MRILARQTVGMSQAIECNNYENGVWERVFDISRLNHRRQVAHRFCRKKVGLVDRFDVHSMALGGLL